MSTPSTAPSCLGLFDSTAPECASCTLVSECVREQERQLAALTAEDPPQESHPPAKAKRSKPKKDRKSETVSRTGNAQLIRKHTRQRLEIPPVGTKLQTDYKGTTYKAEVISDPANAKSGGRSVLFNGAAYETLTAAAHAIAPGINSGSVWRAV